MAQPIAESLKLSDFIVGKVTPDLDDATARRRARGGEGASIAWVIGHLLYYRQQLLALVGETGSDRYDALFGTAGASDGSDYPPLAELLTLWNDTSTQLVPAMEAATDDLLNGPMEHGGPHGEKRVLDTLVFLMWHESYHLGQVGTLRAQFGLTPTATLATS